MPGIQLITQMVFLLLYFIFPSPEQSVQTVMPDRDLSFLSSSMGGFYMQLEEAMEQEDSAALPPMADMPSDEAAKQSDSLSWEDEYEMPVAHGDALFTSKKVTIVSGPYAGITLTADEVEMMEYVVQRETDGSLKHRKIIAEVILNRVKSEEFPANVHDVLTAPRQFSTINNYYNKKRPPDATTKQAVYEVLTGVDVGRSNGATYFYDPQYANPKNAAWFEEDLIFCFQLEGHRFFK